MSTFKVLMYEDTETWKEAFEFRLSPELEAENVILNLMHRFNDSTIMQDLEMLPHLIMVDYDLGASTGEEILDFIDGDPQYQSVPVMLYSGGEPIDKLKEIAGKYKFGIRCYIKDGDELYKAVFSKGKTFA